MIPQAGRTGPASKSRPFFRFWSYVARHMSCGDLVLNLLEEFGDREEEPKRLSRSTRSSGQYGHRCSGRRRHRRQITRSSGCSASAGSARLCAHGIFQLAEGRAQDSPAEGRTRTPKRSPAFHAKRAPCFTSKASTPRRSSRSASSRAADPSWRWEVFGGHRPRVHARRGGAVPPVEAVSMILAGMRGRRGGALAGHRPPRHQAAEDLFFAKRVDGSACVKVLDFGISKVPLESGEHVSLTHSFRRHGHTALYVAGAAAFLRRGGCPQRSLGDRRRALVELLTGRVPYDAPSAPALYAKMLSFKPPSPAEVNPEVDPDLSAGLVSAVSRPIATSDARAPPSGPPLLEPFAPSSMSGAGIRLRAVHDRNTERLQPQQDAQTIANGNALPTQITWEGAFDSTAKNGGGGGGRNVVWA